MEIKCREFHMWKENFFLVTTIDNITCDDIKQQGFWNSSQTEQYKRKKKLLQFWRQIAYWCYGHLIVTRISVSLNSSSLSNILQIDCATLTISLARKAVLFLFRCSLLQLR